MKTIVNVYVDLESEHVPVNLDQQDPQQQYINNAIVKTPKRRAQHFENKKGDHQTMKCFVNNSLQSCKKKKKNKQVEKK